MSRQSSKKKLTGPSRETWICETNTCGEPHQGKNPPDVCSRCGGLYFENMADILKDAGLPVSV